jgi:predicted RNase H-like HicB family nuclease
MRTARVIYRRERDGAWIGTSPDAPGFVAYGDSYEEARDRAQEGLPWFVEDEVLIAHIRPTLGGEAFSQTEGAKSGPRVQLHTTRPPARIGRYRGVLVRSGPGPRETASG